MKTKTIINKNITNNSNRYRFLGFAGVADLNNIDFTVPRRFEKLKPWQVTGLTDGEGSFICTISDTGKGVTGKVVNLEFKVTQKSHSMGILYELQEFFNCGSVVIDNRETDTKKYRIKSLESILEKIIPHFESYPCLTSKYLNYRDWKKIALIMKNKEHLTIEGINKIIEISSKMNKARSFEDKYNYCKTSLGMTTAPSISSLDKIKVQQNSEGEGSTVEIKYNLPCHWVQTYLTGESMFYTYLGEKKSRGIVYQGCDSSLELGQNSHDVAILLSLKKFFNGGYIKPKYNYDNLYECLNSRSLNRYILRNTETIIKFVDKYPMLTRKHLDYLDWKKIVELKSRGAHKTEEGLALIKEIISKVNSGR
nr:hypothetical protein [Lentinula edodes]UZS77616.1 hypothetical protein [Lentinula edodes]UZS77642.1 hypothetical protein [Lentinula edodes]UZS77668.1 hypothetical protein [Lentinula edodes]UZS77694.1 hypothetical protein [Lentinula edodes]